MTDVKARSQSAGRADDESPDPNGGGPPVVHFVPLEGERLEQLAVGRRRPLRWVASALLSVQAGTRLGRQTREEPAPAPADDPGRDAVAVRAPTPIPGPKAAVSCPLRNEPDESMWAAWEAGDSLDPTDMRLEHLGVELDRPLAAPIRLATTLGAGYHRVTRGVPGASGRAARRRRQVIDEG